eukprot:7296760-Pyramimonas_sp.AAC.1
MWSLDKAFNKLRMRAMTGVDAIAKSGEESPQPLIGVSKMSGPASAQVMAKVAADPHQAIKMGHIFDFFSLPAGTFEMWRLAAILAGHAQQGKSTVIKVPHKDEAMMWLNSKAVELELQVSSTQRQFLGA